MWFLLNRNNDSSCSLSTFDGAKSLGIIKFIGGRCDRLYSILVKVNQLYNTSFSPKSG